MFRWWWPHGLVEIAEVQAEIDQIADAGFGGVEIEDVHHSTNANLLDPAGHGWATTPWIDAVYASLTRAKQRGLRTDIAAGPSWPAALPTITPDDEAAAQELVHGRAYVNATTNFQFSGELPHSYVEPEPGVTKEKLIAVQAWRINNASSPTARTMLLDSNTMIDLTSKVTDGKLSWTAPDRGNWVIMPFRTRGTGQMPEAGPHTSPLAYVIDHFSKAGADILTKFWDEKILTTRFHGFGSLFEDSLEFEATTYWTAAYPTEFRNRMGYDIMKYAPTIVREKEKFTIAFTDAEVTRGILNDFWDVLGALYIENHVVPVKEWCHSHGMQLRVQPYGLSTDAMGASAALDIAEGESLGFKNLDDYRSLAGGSNMGQHNIISNEAAAFATSAYTTTWERVLRTLNPIFAAGVNQQVLHGFSYLEAPSAAWPGFAAFTPYGSAGNIGYAESWGPRQPAWRHAPDISAYMGRVQFLMRRGVPKHDVGFFRQKGYIASGFGASYFSAAGTRAGWSMNFLAPSLLQLPIAKVSNKRLAPEGPNFGLLAFEGDAFSSQIPVVTLDTAQRMLSYAQAGLPVLVVGDWSTVRAYGYSEFNQSSQVASTFKQMLALPNVVNVPDRASMADGVAKLGVPTEVQHSDSSLIHIHRVDGRLDHYLFVTNSATEAVDQDVSVFRGSSQAVPYVLDAWTGTSKVLPVYTEVSASRISFRVKLRPGQSMLMTIVPMDFKAVHAVSSTGTVVVDSQQKMAIRSNVSGSYSTVFSNGKTSTTTVDASPSPIDLSSWTLDVEDFTPGPTNTTTTILRHKLDITAPLQPWTALPGLLDVSGIGTYSTTFNLPTTYPTQASNSSGFGASLEMSQFLGSFRIKVNGVQLPAVDQLTWTHDIGAWVKAGENKLEIEVAGSLLNRLRVTSPSTYSLTKRQDFGLVGSPRVVPWRQVQIV
ncbi:secreted protein [Glarea lozoyensis ATCC 20868]|uniref:Secreted protein n=1 Tax=Glarea lozoyensis (strain ATCC 20868 / MF5171) TaxID=1116229 RepID=S3CSG3_GLAL2|nr:uncharacterized protein GLAREA_09731 [Glarea lozoyensis ATCC 20868]EPE28610.1 secreted protein [Glarea lozoyensis ATCC 20868]